MTYASRRIVRSILLILAIMFFAGPATTQITEAERLTRCANNRDALAKLGLEMIGPVGWSDEKIARARTASLAMARELKELEFALEMVNIGGESPDGSWGSQVRAKESALMQIAAPFEVLCLPVGLACVRELSKVLQGQIDAAVSARPRHAAAEREIASYRANLIVWNCEGSVATATPEQSPLAVTPTGPSSRGCKGFVGIWNMGQWGTMRLFGDTGTFSISRESGLSDWLGNTFEVRGAITGATWTGEFYAPGIAGPGSERGRVSWILADDGNSMSGQAWDPEGKQTWSWNGICVGPL